MEDTKNQKTVPETPIKEHVLARDPNAAPKTDVPAKGQAYKNVKNMSIYLTEVGRQLAPFGVITLTEDKIEGSVKHFIDSKILVPVNTIQDRGRNDVVLPAGVKPGADEFGTIIHSGPNKIPGTAEAKTLEETLVTGQQKVQENMEELGKELQKDDEQIKKK